MSYTLAESTGDIIKIGPFLDPDGLTEETALSPTVRLSKDHGTIADRNETASITHDAEGYYSVPLDTTDTNKLGDLLVIVSDPANHFYVKQQCEVVPVYAYRLWKGLMLPAGLMAAGTVTVSDQTTFTLGGVRPSDNDALNGATILFYDQADVQQIGSAFIFDYDGGTQVAVTNKDTTFIVATGDFYQVFAPNVVWTGARQATIQPTLPPGAEASVAEMLEWVGIRGTKGYDQTNDKRIQKNHAGTPIGDQSLSKDDPSQTTTAGNWGPAA